MASDVINSFGKCRNGSAVCVTLKQHGGGGWGECQQDIGVEAAGDRQRAGKKEKSFEEGEEGNPAGSIRCDHGNKKHKALMRKTATWARNGSPLALKETAAQGVSDPL